MAVPYYDFLTSAPIDQTGSALGTNFDYLGSFRSGQGIRNDIDYSDQPMKAVMPPPFTIGDNPDVISDMSLAEYKNFQKYMNERGAADLINTQNQIKPIDGGSDSTGIGEIILPPIAGGGGGGGGGVTPEFLKTYTTGTGATTGTGIDSNLAAKFDQYKNYEFTDQDYIDGINQMRKANPNLHSRTDEELKQMLDMGAFSKRSNFAVPKQNLLQKGIGSIKDFFGKFSSPKIQGELGTRLAKQYTMGQKLPSFIGAIAGTQSPFNPKSKNYNPLLEDQLNIAEANDKVGRDPNSGILKYTENSVLSGQNVISGFGTNDTEKQLEKYLEKVQGVFDKKYGDVDIEELMAKGYTVGELKKLNPTNKFDAQKIKAATYKTKYINKAITELEPYKTKEYIEKKKQIIEKQKEAAKIKAAQELAKAEADKIKETYQLQQQQIKDSGGYAEDVGRGPRRGDAGIADKDMGGFATDDTAGFFAKGGRVRKSYFDGGIVTL